MHVIRSFWFSTPKAFEHSLLELVKNFSSDCDNSLDFNEFSEMFYLKLGYFIQYGKLIELNIGLFDDIFEGRADLAECIIQGSIKLGQ